MQKPHDVDQKDDQSVPRTKHGIVEHNFVAIQVDCFQNRKVIPDFKGTLRLGLRVGNRDAGRRRR